MSLKSNLSEEDFEYFKNTFALYDKDGDGQITGTHSHKNIDTHTHTHTYTRHP
jgi:Ca2+-binding EF-hand superfamily protein